jgi:hypothetical protein
VGHPAEDFRGEQPGGNHRHLRGPARLVPFRG